MVHSGCNFFVVYPSMRGYLYIRLDKADKHPEAYTARALVDGDRGCVAIMAIKGPSQWFVWQAKPEWFDGRLGIPIPPDGIHLPTMLQ